jgi:TRAP transporter TAXI family solute receptor
MAQAGDNLRSVMAIFPPTATRVCPAQEHHHFRDFAEVVSGASGRGASDAHHGTSGSFWAEIFHVVTVPSRTVNLLQDGMIDAGWNSGGIPHGATNEVTSTLDGVVVGLSPEDLKKIEAKYPFLSPSQIPANTYKNQPAPVPATADWSAIFAHKDVPDDLIYKFVELSFANSDLLVATHKSLKDATAANQKFISLPLHPGAYKYFGEGDSYLDKALPRMKRA